jgi:hypothetical protein
MFFLYLLATFTFLMCPAGNVRASIPEAIGTPEAVGTIEDQILSVNGNACGPDKLSLSIAPYFNGHGEPLTYCLSSINLKGGDVENLLITLNPFDGLLNVPLGWFGVGTTIELRIIAKNPYGSAQQEMKILLEPCGG